MPNILATMSKLTSLWKSKGNTDPSELDRATSERLIHEWGSFGSMISLRNERKSKYKDYDEMDREITELSSALDLYADFIVSGGSASEEVYNVEVKKGQKKISDTIENLESRLQTKSRIWYIARQVAKYGDAFYEVVINSYNVVKFVRLSPYTIFVNRTKEGYLDADHPYIQKGSNLDVVVAEFEPWEITHFKMSEGDYGVDNSIYHNTRRTYKIVRMLEDSALIGRLTRAHQRLVYKIDVTNMGVAEALRYIEKLKKMYKGRKFTDNDGKLRTESNLLKPQEDIWLPVRKERSAGVEVIAADPSVRAIADIEHFHNKLFAGTKAPKAYLGFERDVNAKATLTQQHLAFTKAVRRFRHVLALGLRHLYKVEFIMQKIDPNSFEWKLKFPGLGAADDEMKWDIEGMKAQMVSTYRTAGVIIPTDWVIKNIFMDLTPAESDELIKSIDSAPPPPDITTPGNGGGEGIIYPPSDEKIEAALELLKQDKELLQMGERYKTASRTGRNYEYY